MEPAAAADEHVAREITMYADCRAIGGWGIRHVKIVKVTGVRLAFGIRDLYSVRALGSWNDNDRRERSPGIGIEGLEVRKLSQITKCFDCCAFSGVNGV